MTLFLHGREMNIEDMTDHQRMIALNDATRIQLLRVINKASDEIKQLKTDVASLGELLHEDMEVDEWIAFQIYNNCTWL